MRRLLLSLLIAAAVPCQAHELAQGETNILLKHDGTYVAEVKVDPESLVQRLEFAADRELSEGLNITQLQQRIGELEPLLRQRIELRFDGTTVEPKIFYVPLASTQGAMSGLLRLEGTAPAEARQLQWKYGLIYTAYPLKVRREGSEKLVTVWVEGDKLSTAVPLNAIAPPSYTATFRQYTILGFTHILPKGLDHILFVLGIFLLSTRLKPILAQVTAFTVAHSITLALTMYGVVSLPPSIVEPLIALSIVYVAIENISTKKLHSWRVAVVFLFGLLHGMGFAGVLQELGLPRNQFVTALIAFNVGVELGQLTVIALAFILVASWARRHDWYRARVVIPASLVIAVIGAYWAVERV